MLDKAFMGSKDLEEDAELEEAVEEGLGLGVLTLVAKGLTRLAELG